jgi:hypothetical protein
LTENTVSAMNKLASLPLPTDTRTLPPVAVCRAGDKQALMRSLRIAGYHLGAQALAELLRGGHALAEDAFGQTVELFVAAPRSAGA